jgi:hypothetical protein
MRIKVFRHGGDRKAVLVNEGPSEARERVHIEYMICSWSKGGTRSAVIQSLYGQTYIRGYG